MRTHALKAPSRGRGTDLAAERIHGRSASGRSRRVAVAFAEPGFCGRRGADPGDRHRRDLQRVQRRARAAPQAVAVSRAGTTRALLRILAAVSERDDLAGRVPAGSRAPVHHERRGSVGVRQRQPRRRGRAGAHRARPRHELAAAGAGSETRARALVQQGGGRARPRKRRRAQSSAVAASLRRGPCGRGSDGPDHRSAVHGRRRPGRRSRASGKLRRMETPSLSGGPAHVERPPQPLPARDRAAGPQLHARRRARRACAGVGAIAVGIPRRLSRRQRLRDDSHSSPRSDGRRRPAHALDAVRCRRAGPADRLRQRRQSPARARQRTGARAGGAGSAGSRPVAPGATDAGREPRSRPSGRRVGSVDRDLGRGCAPRRRPCRSAAGAPGARGWSGAGVRARCVGGERHSLRALARAHRDADEPPGRAAGRQRVRRAPSPAPAARPGRRRRGAGAGVALRRGAPLAKLQPRRARRSGIPGRGRGHAHRRGAGKQRARPRSPGECAAAPAGAFRGHRGRRGRLPAPERRRERSGVRDRRPSRTRGSAAARRGDSHRHTRVVRSHGHPAGARAHAAGDRRGRQSARGGGQ